MLKKIFLCLFSGALFLSALTSCNSKSKPVVIWTDRAEVVSYMELFNLTNEKTKAVIAYKESLADAFPPTKDEAIPDIIIGSWLKNSRLKKNFKKINSLLGKNDINPAIFYPELLEYGKSGRSQYLLPVSFNLPALFFSAKYEAMIDNDSMISAEKIKELSAPFNKKNAKSAYIEMGFGPTWNIDFVYTLAKLYGVNFQEDGNFFSYDKEKLSEVTDFVKNWTTECNTSSKDENDFSYKYLYVPSNKQIEKGQCLFSYTTSEKLLTLSPEQLENIDFRWISKDKKVTVEDNIVCAGIYKKAGNKKNAAIFLKWFFNEENQKSLIERTGKMHLGTQFFGICNGFSSIRAVTERFYPSLYKNLLGAFPAENSLILPNALPSRWKSLLERVVKPYLKDATNTNFSLTDQPSQNGESEKNDSESSAQAQYASIESRLSTWAKQFN